MEERRTPEYSIDLLVDRANAKDVARGILHIIFFHRIFAPIQPSSFEVLDFTVPQVVELDLETLVDQRVNELLRQLDVNYNSNASNNNNNNGGGNANVNAGAGAGAAGGPSAGSGRALIVVQFREKKRRKNWYGGMADEELSWETWVLNFALASADADVAKARRAVPTSFKRALEKVMAIVDREREHIPPITTNDGNPFPYSIQVKAKNDGWGQRMRIY